MTHNIRLLFNLIQKILLHFPVISGGVVDDQELAMVGGEGKLVDSRPAFFNLMNQVYATDFIAAAVPIKEVGENLAVLEIRDDPYSFSYLFVRHILGLYYEQTTNTSILW